MNISTFCGLAFKGNPLKSNARSFTFTRLPRLFVAALVFCLSLSGCGGGGGSNGAGGPPQAPLITTQPADQSVITGQAANFSVVASGDASLTYQWRRGGVNIDGATGASYSFAQPQLVDSGSVWSVVVANAVGSVTSAGATLTVKTGPGIRVVAGLSGGGGNIDGAVGRFNRPSVVAVDSSGTIYVGDSDNHAIRKMTPTGVVSTLAIMPAAIGAGANENFNRFTGIAVDNAGNVYVTDIGNQLVRKITPLGVVTTLAGSAGSRTSTDGPIATATFARLQGLGLDGAGNIYLADGERVRKITPAGLVSTLWTAPGSIGGPLLPGLTVDTAGTVYAINGEGLMFKITPDGMGTALNGPGGLCNSLGSFQATGIALDASGNLHVAHTSRNTIVKITVSCVATTLAGSATEVVGSTDGIGSAARFSSPQGLTLDGAGNIYVADTRNNTIRKIATDNKVSTLAGTASNAGSINGSGAAARFNNAGFFGSNQPVYVANSGTAGISGVAYAGGVAVDVAGNIYVADTGNNIIRRITVDGVVSTLAGVIGVSGKLDGAAAMATFANPSGVTLDATGNVYVADAGNHRIRKISPTGIVTTIAGANWEDPQTSGGFFPFPISTGSLPVALAIDGTDNIYVADPGVGVLRKVASSGVMTKFNFESGVLPRAVVADAQGNVYATAGCAIVKITADGTLNVLVGAQTICGANDGVGAAARFKDPSGLTLDSGGNLYVADSGNHTIRKVTPAGVVTTLAGRAGISGLVPGNLPGTLNQPVGMAIAATGLLYTTSENAVLKIQLQ